MGKKEVVYSIAFGVLMAFLVVSVFGAILDNYFSKVQGWSKDRNHSAEGSVSTDDFENLVEFLAQNEVDMNEYHFSDTAKLLELARRLENDLELEIVYADNEEEFNDPSFCSNRSLNRVVAYEDETGAGIRYSTGGVFDNVVKENHYIYICADFARDLQKDAVEAGFKCAYVGVQRKEGGGHAINAFELDNMLVFVEPQSDAIIGFLSRNQISFGQTAENICFDWSTDTSPWGEG